MDEDQRRDLLHRLRRPSGTIGSEIPDEIAVRGSKLDLKEFVFECKRLEAVPPERREQIDAVIRDLRRERLERKRRLGDGDLCYEEGERLVRSVHGIDRAVNALEGLDEPDVGEQLRRKRLDDARELLSLIENATQ